MTFVGDGRSPPSLTEGVARLRFSALLIEIVRMWLLSTFKILFIVVTRIPLRKLCSLTYNNGISKSMILKVILHLYDNLGHLCLHIAIYILKSTPSMLVLDQMFSWKLEMRNSLQLLHKKWHQGNENDPP